METQKEKADRRRRGLGYSCTFDLTDEDLDMLVEHCLVLIDAYNNVPGARVWTEDERKYRLSSVARLLQEVQDSGADAARD